MTGNEDDQESADNLQRINGQLHIVQEIVDGAGNVVQQVVSPLMVEFQLRDVLQILIAPASFAFLSLLPRRFGTSERLFLSVTQSASWRCRCCSWDSPDISSSHAGIFAATSGTL